MFQIRLPELSPKGDSAWSTWRLRQAPNGAAVPGIRVQKLMERADAERSGVGRGKPVSITRVAEALFAQGSLDGGQVRGLVDEGDT